MSGQKLGQSIKFKENLVNTLEVTFLAWAYWNFVRIVVLVISRPSSKLGYVRSKLGHKVEIKKYLVNTQVRKSKAIMALLFVITINTILIVIWCPFFIRVHYWSEILKNWSIFSLLIESYENFQLYKTIISHKVTVKIYDYHNENCVYWAQHWTDSMKVFFLFKLYWNIGTISKENLSFLCFW